MGVVILQSHVVPRPHSGPGTASAPRAAASSVSAALGRRKAPILPESRGLRLTFYPPRVASTAGLATGKVRRRGSVVCEAQETTIEVPDVTQSTWQPLVMESDIPVLVEFWAPWCGPCRMVLPVIGKLSKVYEGKIKCLKLNTDENQDMATKYGIRSIPTIIIFKDGEKKDAVIGAVPESTLVTCVEKFVGR